MELDIHHDALATSDLGRNAELFRLFGYQVQEPLFDPIQRVEVALVPCGIEIVG